MRAAPLALWAASSLVVSGCGLVLDLAPEDPTTDSGRHDGRDAGRDAGSADAGWADGGTDAGTNRRDGGHEVDAGLADAGHDAGAEPCRSSLDCADGFYCRRSERLCYGEGTCAPRPTECPDAFDPRCGCDFVLYDNACEAARAGVNVLRELACPVTGSTGEWCDREPSGSDPAGCARCFDDSDCRGSLIEHCVSASCELGVPGVCSFMVGDGFCFDQRQCRAGERCVGAVIDVCPPQDGHCRAP